MLTHGNLASNAATLVDLWKVTAQDVLIHALPIFHVHGLFVASHCALLSGARMLWFSRFDARATVARLVERGLEPRLELVRLDRSLVDYIVALATATRSHEGLALGVSPRGSLSLSLAARATAVLKGRDYAVPDDIVDNVIPVWAHRVISTSGADARRNAPVLREVLSKVPSPA
jgi:hypothetical protein